MVQIINQNEIEVTDLPEVELPQVNIAPLEPATTSIEITKPPIDAPPAEGEVIDESLPAPGDSAIPYTNGVNIQRALNNGYSSDEIKNYMVSKGLTDDDADLAIVSTVSNKIKKAKEAGYNKEEISSFLSEAGYNPDLISRSLKSSNLHHKFSDLDYKSNSAPETEEEEAMNAADLYTNIYSEYATNAKQVIGLMDDDTALSAKRDIHKLNKATVAFLQENSIDSFIDENNGAVMMRNSEGFVSEVDSSIINTLVNSKGEFGGAVSGGLAGARTGASVGVRFGPAGAGVGAAVGGLAGAATGAMAGRAADLYTNSKKLSEDLSTSLYLTQIKQAGIADITFGVLGAAAWKLSAKSYRGLVKSYKYISHGNPKGAYRALKENLDITDDQARDLVSKYEKFNDASIPGDSFEEQAINVISQTVKEGDRAVKSAAIGDERIATIAKENVDRRAKSLIKVVNSTADENVGSLVRKDLTAYQDDVKNYFGIVKKQASDVIDGTDFRFNIDKIAIEPIVKNIEAKLSDPFARERFIAYASRISYASKDRTFSGLLELRTAINDFKYSKILSTKDINAINGVLNKTDTVIDLAAKEYLPDGKQWSNNFKQAKSEYSKMKVLQENTIFRLVNRKSVTEDGIQKALSKYGNNKDIDSEIFNGVVERVSGSTRVKVESAAIKNLLNKSTLGDATGTQAVDFPKLADALRGLNIKTQEGKNIVGVVEEISKLYRNDPDLAGLSARSSLEKTSSLATDLVMKLKQSAIINAWNSIYRYAPFKGSRNAALVRKVENMFNSPLHSKTAEDLIKSLPVPQQAEMRSLVKELQIQQAKKGPTAAPVTTKMYKQSVKGTLGVTDGALGKGIYLVDSIKTPKPGSKVVSQEVDSSTIFDATETGIGNIKDIMEQKNLVEQGYKGIRYKDKVMLFKESIKLKEKE